MTHDHRPLRPAFSLIELMIVIVILGLLVALVAPNLMERGEEAKRKLVCVQMHNIAETLKMFRLDNGVYPSTEEGLEALVENPDEEKYPAYAPKGYFEGNKLPRDSWQTPFIYMQNAESFELVSLGADRREGGEGERADIRYSECRD